jgi:hypothetical protein
MFNKKMKFKKKKVVCLTSGQKRKVLFFLFFLFLLTELGLIHLSPVDRIILLISKNTEAKLIA